MDDLTKEFIAEGQEALDRVERCLSALELSPGDPSLISEIFRAVHTIKGATGFLGFTRLELLAHAGESLLGKLRDGGLQVTADLISGLFELMDGLRQILQLIDTTGGEGERAGDEDGCLIERLGKLVAGEAANQLEPEIPQLVPGAVQGRLMPLERFEVSVAETVDFERGLPPPESSREQAETKTSDATRPLHGGASPTGQEGTTVEKTVRIDVDVLNRMMNQVGELVLTRNRILQSNLEAADFTHLKRRLDAVTVELRETVMEARMQPVGTLFHKFSRMVRDLAKTCGKIVRIELSGLDTGLDRGLLEAIRDPLTHAVRNAVDHGIEAPSVRLRAGKPAEGVIRLRAFHQGGWVMVEMADDGGGVQLEKARARALERGLVTGEQARGMTEREVLDLLFLPGFSTAAAVTHVSGRGVGLDVVRANLERVGGSVELESHAGLGTTLRLRIPLTTAIVPALVVTSCGQSFALPQSALVELVYVPLEEIAGAVERVGPAELYRLRDRLLPLVRLDQMLELGRPGAAARDTAFYVAVLEVDGSRFGLVLDDLLAPEEIVVKPISLVLRQIGMFSGATVLGSGALALILDVAAIAARAGVRKAARQMVHETVSGTAGETLAPVRRFLVFVGQGPQAGRDADRRRERIAIPLEQVERIERVAVQRVEYAGGRPMLQFRGETLPLEDAWNLLEEAGETLAVGRQVTVLICNTVAGGRDGATRRVGVVVQQVLHVKTGRLLPVVHGEQRLALIDERVTTMHEPFAPVLVRAETGQDMLREVA